MHLPKNTLQQLVFFNKKTDKYATVGGTLAHSAKPERVEHGCWECQRSSNRNKNRKQ